MADRVNMKVNMLDLDQEKWDNRFLDLCEHVSEWSKDPSTKVGAVITEGIHIVSIGYNGLPSGVHDDPNILHNREQKYKFIIHAEMNAILAAKRPVAGSTLYTFPLLPCTNCASVCIQAGIRRVVSQACVDNRWKSNIEEAKELFKKAAVEVVELF